MLYFNPRPNFQLLGKYYRLHHPADQLEQMYPDGYPIVIDWCDTDEKVKDIEYRFFEITQKWKLEEHFDNLIALSLIEIQGLKDELYELNFQYAKRKRTKELAGFLLGFIDNSKDQYDGLLLKTFKSTHRISDQVVIEWAGRIIMDAIQRGDMKLNDFQFDIQQALFDKTDKGLSINRDKLITEAKKTVHLPTKAMNARLADFCFLLYDYLVNETNINPDPSVQFSDAQLNFYFEVLVLFEFINPDIVESEPKDYMSAILRNRLKQLDSQGNKSNKK